MGVESSFRNIILFHMDLVVSRSTIQFGEEVGTIEFIKDIINDWDGKLIFNSQFIEGMEIRTHMPITFLF